MKMQHFLLPILLATLPFTALSTQIGFSGKLPDSREWQVENAETDSDNLWIKLSDGGNTQQVEFHDQSSASFLGLRHKLPDPVAYELRTQGFVLKARMQLNTLPEEVGNTVDISLRLPECDALNLFLWRDSQSGKLSLRSWDSVEKEHRQYSTAGEAEAFFDLEMTFIPDSNSLTAGKLTVSVNSELAYECIVALSEHTGQPSILISSGNASSTDRFSHTLFESFTIKAGQDAPK